MLTQPGDTTDRSFSSSLAALLTTTRIRWVEVKGAVHAASTGSFNGSAGGFSGAQGFGFGGGSKRTVFGGGNSTNPGGGPAISFATGPKVDVFGASAPPSFAAPLQGMLLLGFMLMLASPSSSASIDLEAEECARCMPLQ